MNIYVTLVFQLTPMGCRGIINNYHIYRYLGMSIPSYEQLGQCQSKFYFEWYLGVTWDFLRMCVVSVYFMCVPLELLDLFSTYNDNMPIYVLG